MVPLLFAAYLGSRPPGITPLRPPVPVVHVHHQRADSATECLAEALDMQRAFERPQEEPCDGSGTSTRSVVPYAESPADTEPAGWTRFACALFSQTA